MIHNIILVQTGCKTLHGNGASLQTLANTVRDTLQNKANTALHWYLIAKTPENAVQESLQNTGNTA